MRQLLIFFMLMLPSVAAAQGCPEWTLENSDSTRYETRLLRSKPWVDTVAQTLFDEGLDAKWLYLMLAESGGNPAAQSKHGARGSWQLMPATAKHYGCNDLTDPAESTRAAARYLRKLMLDFDNDRDVVIAYNMGGTNYKRKGRATAQAEALANEVMCLFAHDPLHLTSY